MTVAQVHSRIIGQADWGHSQWAQSLDKHSKLAGAERGRALHERQADWERGADEAGRQPRGRGGGGGGRVGFRV